MKLSDEELWDKCHKNEPITSEDLGLTNLNRNDDPFYYTEGIEQKKD